MYGETGVDAVGDGGAPERGGSVLQSALTAAERAFRSHPALLFGVIVDVILASLAAYFTAQRVDLVIAIVVVTVLVLVVWRFSPQRNSRVVTITGSHGVKMRNSMNRNSQSHDDSALTISGATGVTVEGSFNSGDAAPATDLSDDRAV